MNIEVITTYSDALLDAMNSLLPELNPSARSMSKDTLCEIIASQYSHLFMAQTGGVYCGSLSLVILVTPIGKRALIEDVVVSADYRGRGIGRLLCEKAIALASEIGAKSINLTSRSSRIHANELYRKLGFEPRETNAYRLTLSPTNC